MIELIDQLLGALPQVIPTLAVITIVVIVLWAADWALLRRRENLGEEARFPRRIVMLVLTGIGLLLIFLALPVSPDTRGQLFGIVGLIFSAIIALSSTTFVSNAMAGFMLRGVRSFRPGDFIKVGEQFGRVTERGLFHTEIQTEDRDLTTLPNLFLVSHPITVVHSSGTIVSASVSLGYDIPHERIEQLLKEAAIAAKLQEPFVQIKELGDFSVTYRIAGFLPEVNHLLTTRSKLRKMMLRSLHEADVEIVSPTFMTQRRVEGGARTLPLKPSLRGHHNIHLEDGLPEDLIFDKAEQKKKGEELRRECEDLRISINNLKASCKTPDQDTAETARLQRQIYRATTRIDAITKYLALVEKTDKE